MLNRLQAQLQGVYDLVVPLQVEDFLFHDRELAYAYAGQKPSPEQLFVRQAGADLDISLYLDANTAQLLRKDDPFTRLHNGNLNAFWLAIEGVSHFLYLTWNALQDKAVTELEMELQADVDKFVISTRLLREQSGRASCQSLMALLFHRYRLRSNLSSVQRQRYRLASQSAGRYCSRIQPLVDIGEHVEISRQLRRFYRQPKLGKLGRL